MKTRQDYNEEIDLFNKLIFNNLTIIKFKISYIIL